MVVKKSVYSIELLFLLVFASIAVQGITEKIIIDIPGTFIMNGKNVSVLGSTGDSISVDVDGVIENVNQDKIDNLSKNVNGVHIQILALTSSPQRAILNVSVYINCGNNACEVGEDAKICCADCGCNVATQICTNNRCLENLTSSKNQCYTNVDCEDNNRCTTEYCDTTEYPNKCVRAEISACVSGDTCCPKLCDTDKDSDCANVDKCQIDQDCVDSEVCTQETCTGAPKRCQSAHQDGCTYQGVCIIAGTVQEGKYCEGKSHAWIAQKTDQQSCALDYECLSAVCDNGTCGKNQSKMLKYAFYTIGLLALIMGVFYFSLSRKTTQQ